MIWLGILCGLVFGLLIDFIFVKISNSKQYNLEDIRKVVAEEIKKGKGE